MMFLLFFIVLIAMSVSSNDIVSTTSDIVSTNSDITDYKKPYVFNGITHPVIFHIIHKSNGVGVIKYSALVSQINQLNLAFSGIDSFNKRRKPVQSDTKIRFSIYNVTYIENNDFFDRCRLNSRQIKKENAVRPDKYLNVYTCFLYSIGFTTGPNYQDPDNNFKGIPNNHYLNGIMIHYTAFPGGSLPGLNKGHVLTHELGHFYGLLHPYTNGCTTGLGIDGDGLGTPRMKKNLYGPCKNYKGLDSCPNLRGRDDVTNYMLATDDSCRDHFTENQIRFMHFNIIKYRSNLLISSN